MRNTLTRIAITEKGAYDNRGGLNREPKCCEMWSSEFVIVYSTGKGKSLKLNCELG